MAGLGWWRRRLQAMSPAEVVHRTWRLARYPVELLRMRTGLYARPSRTTREKLASWRGPQTRLPLPQVDDRLHEQARQICEGKRQVLGLGWVSLPDPPWHFEPNARATWPIVDAPRVRAAAPAHFDPRLTWEINRGHEWVVLALTHHHDQLASELASWRDHNPIGTGINWVSPMEAAMRIHSLAWVAQAVDDEVLLRVIATMVYEQAIFVGDHLSYGSSANNHLLVELTALVVAARVVDVAPLQQLRKSALRCLDSELARQVYPDGVNVEMATHYHAFVLEALLLAARFERAHGHVQHSLEAVIARMTEYFEAVRCPDGAVLHQGDNDDGHILRSADHAAQPPETSTSRLFADGGQVVFRSARLLATFDVGPFGFGTLAAHAHCDCLAVNVAIDGRPIIVDRGTYRYNGDPEGRMRYRMTAAHNTVQVGTREQAESGGMFLWTRRPAARIERCHLGGDGDVVIGSHDGFSPCIHRRIVLHRDGVLVVFDELRGSAEDGVARLHLAPGIDVVHLWSTAAQERVRTRHSSVYGAEEEAWTIEMRVDHRRPHCFVLTPSPLASHHATLQALVARALATGIEKSVLDLLKGV